MTKELVPLEGAIRAGIVNSNVILLDEGGGKISFKWRNKHPRHHLQYSNNATDRTATQKTTTTVQHYCNNTFALLLVSGTPKYYSSSIVDFVLPLPLLYRALQLVILLLILVLLIYYTTTPVGTVVALKYRSALCFTSSVWYSSREGREAAQYKYISYIKAYISIYPNVLVGTHRQFDVPSAQAHATSKIC